MAATAEPGRRSDPARHETGVLLALPELAGFTHPWRATSYGPDHPGLPIERRFPPHVTVLTPWVGEAGDPRALARLAAAVEGVAALRLSFAEAQMFPNGAVWLRPEPADAVADLLDRVARAFAEHPPYEGLHDQVVPHLTVSVDGGERVLAQVRRALTEQGPQRACATALTTWGRGLDDVWREMASVPLRGSCPASA